MHDSITTIIIDDEPNSISALKNKLLNHCPEIMIIAECLSPEEGIQAISQHWPQLVFLDVKMPRMNGFVMLQQLENIDFEIIFTTAYDQYAIDAIRVSALDYLVKPIEVDKLKAAVERMQNKRKETVVNRRLENLLHNISQQNNSIKRLAIPTLDGFHFIDTDRIIYLEAIGNYTLLYLTNENKKTASRTLKDFDDILPTNIFVRIHHSYIINKNHVTRYIKGEGGQVIMTDGKTLDVARRKKVDFLKAINKV